MKTSLLLTALLYAGAFALGDAVSVPPAVDFAAPVTGGVDAIAIPRALSYQGKLTDNSGNPVPDTTYSVSFRLYTVASGGTAFWNETQTVRTKSGLFSTLLGSVTPIGSMPDAGNVYLGMAVSGGAELTPRLRLASSAYAYLSERAASADLLQGKDTTALDARYVNEAQANSVTSAMIVNGTIAAADLNQMGATANQVLKWTGSAWAPRNDSVGGGGSADNAWVRGSPDSVLLTIRNLGIARGGAGNALLGTQPFTHVNLGTQCSTGFHAAAVVHATIGGGYGNLARSNYAAVGGGDRNRALEYSSVSGGSLNEATGQYAAIGGGSRNEATGQYAAIGGGASNDAGGQYAAVGGGAGNRANGWNATVAGGGFNSASDSSATVAGGSGNEATAKNAAVGGGNSNAANAGYATVGGGYDNTASGTASSVGGGSRNSALGASATVAGGVDNRTMDNASFVGGGSYNRADGAYSVIAGGASNSVTGERSTIAGGSQNIVNGTYAAVGGGSENSAYGYYSMIPGGEQNRAAGRHSFAAGRYARANHRGAFVWSDSAASAAESVYSTNYNQFRVRARGGTWFFSNSSQTTGVTLASNSNAWASTCDSTNKEDFREVDRRELLEKLAALRVRNYKMKDQDDGTRHIGPVAQDFSAAFGVGEDNTSINMADADGVLFAAVQALYEQNLAQQAEIEALKARLVDRE
ncbi:MAG: tail fiber domain-containing protein [bacterium]